MTNAPPSAAHRAEPLAPGEEPGSGDFLRNLHVIKLLLVGIFLFLLAGFLFLTREFLLPVALAFLFAIVLGPVVRWLQRRGIPAWTAATALVVLLFIGISSGAYVLSGPVAALISDAPRISVEVQKKLAVIRQPMEILSNASRQLEELTRPGNAASAVVVEQGGIVGVIASGASSRLIEIGFCLVLVLFMLASGDLFYEKLIKVLPTLSDKKRAVRIAREVESEVSRYFFTITIVNLGVGVVIGTIFWALGMPSPVLWALMAFVLNYLPYLGAATGIGGAFAIAVVAFDTLGQAALPPLAYFAVAIIEGQIVTPMIVGRRLELNSVVILISIAFWGWLWGIVGALIAVPMLVTVKVFADHVDSLRGLGEFLGARDVNGHGEKAEAAAAEAAVAAHPNHAAHLAKDAAPPAAA